MRFEVRKNLPLDEFHEDCFRCGIWWWRWFRCGFRRGRSSGWFRCGRCSRFWRRWWWRSGGRRNGWRRRRLIAGRNFAARNWCTRRIALHARGRRADRFWFRRGRSDCCIRNGRRWRFRWRISRWCRRHNRRSCWFGTGRGFRASHRRTQFAFRRSHHWCGRSRCFSGAWSRRSCRGFLRRRGLERITHLFGGDGELRTDVRDLFEDGLRGQSFLHQPRHDVLQKESVKPADHHDGVEDDQECRHRSAEPEATVQNHERDRQDREPDVGAQPALHRPDSPERDFFSKTEENSENKNRERDRSEPKPERRPANSVMLSRRLDQRPRQVKP